MAVVSGISSTISAGQNIGGSQNVAGNLIVGQNVTIGGTLTVNGKAIVPPTTPPVPLNWNKQGGKNQSAFNVPSSNVPLFVTRNGLIEIPGLHYSVANGVLTFTTPCIGGETIYGYWTNP